MEYRIPGKSNLQLSRIGFGCMSLGPDMTRTEQLISEAIDLGINYFDTADLYQQGYNEEMVGRALKPRRKEVTLATKVGNQLRPGGNGWDWNPRKEYILSAIDKSLKRLQTDYIDLYQLHGGTMEVPIDETIDAFETLVKLGKIRYYGISSIRPDTIRTYSNRSSIVSVMMQYSLLDRRPEETCLGLLQDRNIGVVTRGSLAKGLLAGKSASDYNGYDSSEVQRMIQLLQSLSRTGGTMGQVALQFVLAHPAITSVVVGIRTREQLLEAAQVFQASPLQPQDRELLADLLVPKKYEDHR